MTRVRELEDQLAEVGRILAEALQLSTETREDEPPAKELANWLASRAISLQLELTRRDAQLYKAQTQIEQLRYQLEKVNDERTNEVQSGTVEKGKCRAAARD